MPSFASGDNFLVWGWAASDTSCTATTGTPSHACFGFEDQSGSGWTVVGPYLDLSAPTGSLFLPTSAEYIAEVSNPSVNGNASYGYDVATGAAWDTTPSEHPDPGTTGATDPEIL